ncbi:MAG: hypothetical protein IKV73_01875 [Clostridia bacterium]|nr:hypothetical protein [Clostridia bacterium]
MELHKKQMHEAAILYYEKKQTQNEIAQTMGLSRQTVSKMLNDAIKEKIVEIKIYNPDITCSDFEKEIADRFQVQNAIVCPVSNSDESLCRLMAVKKAASYIKSVIDKGNKKIAISWGRTVRMIVDEMEKCNGEGNVVFPLFGATDQEQDCFLSNEIARSFADKTGAELKYAWFPYKPDSIADCELLKKTSYYQKLTALWDNIDVAIVGIGNKDIIRIFGKIFGYSEKCVSAVGDISTHFFNEEGEFVELYENTLCASVENLKNASQVIAVASGDDKVEAIISALHTGVIDTLITDEYTARKILD